MGRTLKIALAGAALVGAMALGAAVAQPPAQVDAAGAAGPYSVFTGTMADMTWPDVEAQAKGGAVALWGIAVIEEHGPALPLATDTYGSAAITRLVKADLGAKGTWYRLRIAGFSDKDVASALCDRLKADGGGCFLGK